MKKYNIKNVLVTRGDRALSQITKKKCFHSPTTSKEVYGSGRYYLRSGVGGSGYGLDIGLATKEFNGMRFGASLINALGVIKWNSPSFFKDLLAGKDNKFGNSDDIWHLKWDGTALTDSVSVIYTYSIDSLRADNLSSDGKGSIFKSRSEVVYNLDENNIKRIKIYPNV